MIQPAEPKTPAAPPDAGERPTVCQVVHSLEVGGAELLVAGLASGLADRYRFVFACLDDLGTLGKALRNEGRPVRVLGRRPGIDWRCAKRLAAFLHAGQVDLIHAHQYTPFLQSLLARLGWRHPPVLFTEHGRHHPDLPRLRRKLGNRILLERRDRVVAVGQAVRSALVKNEGIPASRIEVVYNGVDLAPFLAQNRSIAPGDGPRGAARAELGLSDSDFAVLQVARLHALKDHATAIRAIERLVHDGIPARLFLVGDGEERGGLEAEVVRRDLKHAVHFLGLRRDVPRLLQAADAALLTSISEGIPLTVIEAMAAALPVVSTDVGGIGEMIDDGTTGLLAPAGDDAAIAGCLRRLAVDPELGAALGRAGRHRAQERFSLERMHRAYRRLYDEMLAAGRGGRAPIRCFETRVTGGRPETGS